MASVHTVLTPIVCGRGSGQIQSGLCPGILCWDYEVMGSESFEVGVWIRSLLTVQCCVPKGRLLPVLPREPRACGAWAERGGGCGGLRGAAGPPRGSTTWALCGCDLPVESWQPGASAGGAGGSRTGAGRPLIHPCCISHPRSVVCPLVCLMQGREGSLSEVCAKAAPCSCLTLQTHGAG